jgi:hypothetical protein
MSSILNTQISELNDAFGYLMKGIRYIDQSFVGKEMVKIIPSYNSNGEIDANFLFINIEYYNKRRVYRLERIDLMRDELYFSYNNRTKEIMLTNSSYGFGWVIIDNLSEKERRYFHYLCLLDENKQILQDDFKSCQDFVLQKQCRFQELEILEQKESARKQNEFKNHLKTKFSGLISHMKNPNSWSKKDIGKYVCKIPFDFNVEFYNFPAIYSVQDVYHNGLLLKEKNSSFNITTYNHFNFICLNDIQIRFCFNCLSTQLKTTKPKYLKCFDEHCYYVYYCSTKCREENRSIHLKWCG